MKWFLDYAYIKMIILWFKDHAKRVYLTKVSLYWVILVIGHQ